MLVAHALALPESRKSRSFSRTTKNARLVFARALSIKVIAFEMGVSESTVSRLAKSGMQKLGLKT